MDRCCFQQELNKAWLWSTHNMIITLYSVESVTSGKQVVNANTKTYQSTSVHYCSQHNKQYYGSGILM